LIAIAIIGVVGYNSVKERVSTEKQPLLKKETY
jgi:hypothetical protein